MKKDLAIFDFDGTITRKDSLIEFVKFYKGGKKFVTGIILLSPVLILMKAGLISSRTGKQLFLRYFFNGERTDLFGQQCLEFAGNIIPKLIRKEAFRQINWHKNRNDDIYIVSASPECYLQFWAKALGCHCLGTKLEFKDGLVTGNLIGKNCKGPEKVRRLKEKVNLADFNKIYAYGDSKGDREMLDIADYPYFRKFTDHSP